MNLVILDSFRAAARRIGRGGAFEPPIGTAEGEGEAQTHHRRPRSRETPTGGLLPCVLLP
jgi:hypothetical protein